MPSSTEVYKSQVTAVLSLVLSTREEIPAMYGPDPASAHASKIPASNPRRIFRAVLSRQDKCSTIKVQVAGQ